MIKIIKKYWFLAAVVAVNLALLIIDPKTETVTLRFAGRNVINFLFMLTPVFICVGLMDVWISRESMIKFMGVHSGVKGAVVALLLGVVTAVPLYALLPVAGVLLKKGSRISNVLLFLCASASIRIPLLLFEISSLGFLFTFARFGLNIMIVIAIAVIIDKLLSEDDKRAIYDNAERLI